MHADGSTRRISYSSTGTPAICLTTSGATCSNSKMGKSFNSTTSTCRLSVYASSCSPSLPTGGSPGTRTSTVGFEISLAGKFKRCSGRFAGGVAPHVRLSLALLDAIQQKAHARGAKMLILEIPFRRDRVTFNSTFPFDAARSMGLDFDVVSPIEQFQQYRGEKIYWEKGHGHWTPLGTSCVARALAERILSGNLVVPRTPEHDEQPAPGTS